MPLLLHLFTLLFVGLKLGGVIDWNWFFVVLPSLIPLFLLLIVMIRYPVFIWQSKLYSRIRRWLEKRGWRNPRRGGSIFL